MRTDCKCPNECIVDEYGAELSYATLSTFSVTSVLANNETLLQNNYLEALELHARVNKEEFFLVVSGLTNTTALLKRFLDIGRKNARETADGIQRSLCQLISMTMNDHDVIQRNLLRRIYTDYQTYFESIRPTLEYTILNCVTLFRHLKLYPLPGEHIIQTINEARFCVTKLCAAMELHQNLTKHNADLEAILPRIDSIRECVGYDRALDKCVEIKNILHAYHQAKKIFDAYNMTELIQFEMIEMDIQAEHVLACIQKYPNFLETFYTYVNMTRDNLQEDGENCLNSENKDTLVGNIHLEMIDKHYSEMLVFLADYVQNRASKQDLTKVINSQLSSDIDEHLEKIQSKILLNILEPQREQIAKFQTSIVNMYLYLLESILDLSAFFIDNRIEQAARQMNVWRGIVLFQSQNLSVVYNTCV